MGGGGQMNPETGKIVDVGTPGAINAMPTTTRKIPGYETMPEESYHTRGEQRLARDQMGNVLGRTVAGQMGERTNIRGGSGAGVNNPMRQRSLRRRATNLENVEGTIAGGGDRSLAFGTGEAGRAMEAHRAAQEASRSPTESALDALRSGVGGAEAGVVFEGVRQFPVVVRFDEADRNTPAAIGRIILESSSGARIPLESVADISEIVGPRQITRENGERFITVQLNVRDRDIGSYVADAQAAVEAGLDLPPGYRVEWGGQYELQQQANARFAVVIPITLGIVFLILLLTFGRLMSAVLILLNIPLALTGGALALWVAGLPVSVPATVGFIALFGIALGNGMVLVSFMDDFARAGRGRDELAIEAAGLRALPVLMTALTTALGLAPLLFATGVGAEVQRPLATVVTGGLISSTVLTLLVVPALHRWFAPKPEGHHSLIEARHEHLSDA